MHLLIADKVAAFVPQRLEALGWEVHREPSLAGEELTARLAALAPRVLVVRSTRVGASQLQASGALRLIVRAGSGINTIDVEHASEQHICIANCPGKNAAAVAELTMAHLLNLDRRIFDNVQQLRLGCWNKKELGKARGLSGRTLAVLGCGVIGREVVRRAKAFEMHVVGWSRGLDAERAAQLGIEPAASPEEAVSEADAVSVHLALAPETRRRIGRSVFERMRPGALFINSARAELVDGEALSWAVDERGIRVGLDVYEREPSSGQGTMDDPILSQPCVYGTHHIGASTEQAEEAVGAEVVRIVEAYRAGDPIPNRVNRVVPVVDAPPPLKSAAGGD